MKVREAMQQQPVTIAANDTIQHAANMFDKSRVGALLVMEGERLVGLVTDRDLVTRAMAVGAALDGRIDSVMSTDVVACEATEELSDALSVLSRHGYRRLPVVEEGKVLGIVTLDDVLALLTDQLGEAVEAVRHQLTFGRPEARPPVKA
jgi:CBS domain-containing protein